MSAGIRVVKGHAYGNDFLLAPESDVRDHDLPALARAMCNRHEGIGADGLMVYTFGPASVGMLKFRRAGQAPAAQEEEQQLAFDFGEDAGR